MARIAVLGCGPQGVLCAYAAEKYDHTVNIYSRKVKSVIPGSQHLHGHIDGLTRLYPEGTIQFVRIGTAEGYAEKVYADPSRTTGWENYLQVFPFWSVQKMYDKLWDMFQARIRDLTVTPHIEANNNEIDVYTILASHDLVISTLPAPELCMYPNMHEFESVPYFIRVLPTPEKDKDKNIVVYNGIREDMWYRWSLLDGKCAIEYTESVSGDEEVGRKAIANNCTCWPKIRRCGRWAEWRHGVTMYSAYQDAERMVRELA